MHMPSGILTHAHRHHRYGREASLGVYEILTRLERSSVDRDDDIMAKLASTLLNLGRAEDAVPWTPSRGTCMYECVIHETQDMRWGSEVCGSYADTCTLGKTRTFAYIRTYIRSQVVTCHCWYRRQTRPRSSRGDARTSPRSRSPATDVSLTCNSCVAHLQQMCLSPATNVSHSSLPSNGGTAVSLALLGNMSASHSTRPSHAILPTLCWHIYEYMISHT